MNPYLDLYSSLLAIFGIFIQHWNSYDKSFGDDGAATGATSNFQQYHEKMSNEDRFGATAMSSTSKTNPLQSRHHAKIAPHEKVDVLEAQLLQVTSNMNCVTKDFMTLREALANENAYLIVKRDDLQHQIKTNQRAIVNLTEENRKTREHMSKIEKKLQEMASAIRTMSNQRSMLLKKIDEWEDSLTKAAFE